MPAQPRGGLRDGQSDALAQPPQTGHQDQVLGRPPRPLARHGFPLPASGSVARPCSGSIYPTFRAVCAQCTQRTLRHSHGALKVSMSDPAVRQLGKTGLILSFPRSTTLPAPAEPRSTAPPARCVTPPAPAVPCTAVPRTVVPADRSLEPTP
ncbi:hypothetical protein GCM10010504_42350 [Streptomyces griseus]|nr:hypothetical protein GCM10010504_42350 [Streptomyces griseus]